jgi:chitinase
VFLVENAIEGIEQAKELEKEEEKEEAKEKLLTILSVVFLIVPFLREAAAIAAGATTIARIIAIISAGANLGFSLETVIKNPEMAPFAVIDLLSLGRLRSPKDYADAAKFRSAMKDTDVTALGTKFATQDGMIQKIIRVCKK